MKSPASCVRAIQHESAHPSISWEDRVIRPVKVGNDLSPVAYHIHVPIGLDNRKDKLTTRR
jgi:hypothetical protein